MTINNNSSLDVLIKETVRRTLQEARLGSTEAFEDFVVRKESDRIIHEIGQSHLSLKKVIKMQSEFAGIKRKYSRQKEKENSPKKDEVGQE